MKQNRNIIVRCKIKTIKNKNNKQIEPLKFIHYLHLRVMSSRHNHLKDIITNINIIGSATFTDKVICKRLFQLIEV